jgi:hypothetical protein
LSLYCFFHTLEQEKKTMVLDYSKWDRLELSDDDDADCHPNIEKMTWRRLKKEARERKLVEEQDIRKKELDELEILKSQLLQISPIEERKKKEERIDELSEHEKKRKENELHSPKLTADSICRDKFDSKTMINRDAERTNVSKEQNPQKVQQDESSKDDDLERRLQKFVDLETFSDMALYLSQYPELISDEMDILLIEKAHKSYGDKQSSQSYNYLRHSLVLRYIIKLASGRPLLPSLRAFFDKITDPKDDQYRKGFELDLNLFFDQLKNLPSFNPQNSEIL